MKNPENTTIASTSKRCSDCSNCFPREKNYCERFYCILYREEIESSSAGNIYYADACKHFEKCEGDENTYRLHIYMT
jgi:hypothetical protein